MKELTKTKYNHTYAEDEPVSTFVTAFYDAVLLYAYALNDSIAQLGVERALRQPINGTHLAQLMWGRSFKGITGNVTIDSNGDRISNYSLLDLNPETGLFEVSNWRDEEVIPFRVVFFRPQYSSHLPFRSWQTITTAVGCSLSRVKPSTGQAIAQRHRQTDRPAVSMGPCVRIIVSITSTPPVQGISSTQT